MNPPGGARILVACPAGVLGQALTDRLVWAGHGHVTVARGLDLRERDAVLALFEAELPDYVVLVPAQVVNPLSLRPAQWLHDNLVGAANVIHAAYLYDVEKLLCLDCSATFMHPVVLPSWAGSWTAELLEEVRRACAVTRSATAELCGSYHLQYGCNFVSAVAGHVYGPDLNFGAEGPHLVPTLLREVRRARDAGQPGLRLLGHASGQHDLLHLHDLAGACLFLLERGSPPGPVAVGSGEPRTLAEVAGIVGLAAGYAGTIEFDGDAARARGLPTPGARAPDPGPLQALGWQPGVTLAAGLQDTWRWYTRACPPAAP